MPQSNREQSHVVFFTTANPDTANRNQEGPISETRWRRPSSQQHIKIEAICLRLSTTPMQASPQALSDHTR
jgi:hypothetical protein